jgi:tetratricopeptide (TPR) repeat protein
MNSIAQQAIHAALSGDWKTAISLNLTILKTNPEDIDSMNRIAKAYSEINKIAEAKKYAHKVIKLDPFNQIALKSLSRWGKAKQNNSVATTDIHGDPSAFLEEPGKTKIINLINLGSSDVLETLNNADEVKISAYTHKVCITTLDGKYIGKLPDDLSARLRTLVKGGNVYKVFVKSVEKELIRVFIREVKRGGDYLNTPSFPAEKIDYISYAPPELVSVDKPYVENYEEGA